MEDPRGGEGKERGHQTGQASDEVDKTTAKMQSKVTKELREQQGRLTGATADLIRAVVEAKVGVTEEALLEWLEEQGDRMENLKESLDQKRRELTRRGSWGQESVAGRKPREPEDQILRKIHMAHLNADKWLNSVVLLNHHVVQKNHTIIDFRLNAIFLSLSK